MIRWLPVCCDDLPLWFVLIDPVPEHGAILIRNESSTAVNDLPNQFHYYALLLTPMLIKCRNQFSVSGRRMISGSLVSGWLTARYVLLGIMKHYGVLCRALCVYHLAISIRFCRQWQHYNALITLHGGIRSPKLMLFEQVPMSAILGYFYAEWELPRLWKI